ncbi:MAG TPA: mechanosensitive ion channel domain-containing protein [Verrucomicrobiae bacterium]
MTNILIRKDALETAGNGISRLSSRILESVFGPGVHHAALGPITWADLAATLFIVIILLIAHSVTAGWMRRFSRRSASTSWQRNLINAASQPLYLLIWVVGAYIAMLPILARLTNEQNENVFLLVWNKLFDAGIFVMMFWLFLRLTHVVEAQLLIIAAKSNSKLDDAFVPLIGKTLRVVVPVVAVILALPVIGLPPAYSGVVGKASSLLIIGAVSWVLMQAVCASEKMLLSRYDITAADNLQARKVYTQVHVISKTIYVLIGIFTIASALMLFEEVRRFGASILASAGVLGIIVGFAAQRTIANLFAGFQLAMTQPIRMDDVLIVENEWGRVEEITLTYVVIRIWDDRRLVVPLSYFIEKPFQNWTRVSAQLMGSVFLWVDYTVPVEELRAATKRIVEASPLWDRRFWNLQVTDTSEHAVQLRILVTTADSSKGWDLRCEVREKIIAFIQKNHPDSLPRFRAELDDRSPASPLPDKQIPNPLPAA